MPSNTNATLGGGGFHHVAIRVRDFDKSHAFYTDVLGFAEKIHWGEKPKRAVMLDTGDGNYLEMFERCDQPAPPAVTPGSDSEPVILHFAIRTTVLDDALERARAAGCEVTMEPADIEIRARQHLTPIRIAFFKGPDGEVVELFQNELT